MKKVRILGVVIIFSLLTTGCMKSEVSINIKQDKSMEFSVIQAINNELLKEEEASSTLEELKEKENDGFKVETYIKDDMTGYKITMSCDNIDQISTTENNTTKLIPDKADDKMFKVNKGFFKNTYSIKIKAPEQTELQDQISPNPSTGLSKMTNNKNMGKSKGMNADNMFDNTQNLEVDEDFNVDKDLDYSVMLNGMDFTFNISIPYKALKNNATSVTDNGTKLSWDLLKMKDKVIECEFFLYNANNISIAAGIVDLFLIGLIILLLLRAKKTKKGLLKYQR